MRLGSLGIGALWSLFWGVTHAQVQSLQSDLKLQEVWNNVWGIIQIVFLPEGKVMTVHKTGQLHIYDSILSKSQDYTTILDIEEEVYSWWDHGLLSAALHPKFPAEPYIFIAYSAEYPDKPWNDNCEADPVKMRMSSPPDTRPYCKSMAKILRLKVDDALTTATVDGELFHDWCTSTYTHHIGTLNFLADGSMVYGAGDGSHFQGIDHGQPQDECVIVGGPKDQGVFTSQKNGFLRGKFIVIKPDSIMKDDHLKEGDDYTVISRGARNCFRSTVHPKTGDVYFGDVGSSVWEEINEIPNPLTNPGQVINFGWPCIEGVNSVSDIFQNFLKQEHLNTCDVVYEGGAKKPMFVYRNGPVDPDFPDECADADASVSGIHFYTGEKLPAHYNGKLFWVDYSKKCGFWFDEGLDGKPDFSHAHAFMSTVGASSGGLTDVKTGPDGYLYVADYSGGRLYRIGSIVDKEMDELLTRAPPRVDQEKESLLWIESTPNPYEWKYGDTITYELTYPTSIDMSQVKWRVTNGHCVLNQCTGNQDCHFHEVSLSADSQKGPAGNFKPSPHPMESFIKITATAQMPDGTEETKDFITHGITYNYKIISDPPGLPIIFEELTCMVSPCLGVQMAGTNPGFVAQTVQAYNDQLYTFDSWTSMNAATDVVKTTETNLYEDVADADYLVKANYKPLNVIEDKAMSLPEGISVEGGYKRIEVKWTPVAGNGPDYLIITIRTTTTPPTVEKSFMPTANKDSALIPMPAGEVAYKVELSFFESKVNTRGPRTAIFPATTRAQASKAKKNCIYDPFAIDMKKSMKAGLADKYQLAIVGDYPSTIRPQQKVKLTFDVVSDTATSLMINILQKEDFSWAGGITVPVPAKKAGLTTVNFVLEGNIVNKKEYYINALLVTDAMDYKSAYVEDSVKKIFGIVKLDHVAAAPAAPAVAVTKDINAQGEIN